MDATPFDTHKAVSSLTGTGIPAPQAEAIVDVIRTAITGGVATKADLAELKAKMAELKAEMAALETRLTWRIVLASGIIIATIGALVRF